MASFSGVSLTEIMICLVILAEIATFTIPKVLISSQNHRMNAVAMETASMMAEALHIHQLKNGMSANTKLSDITPYLNYVKVSTSPMAMDYTQGGGYLDCNGGYICLVLHNGAMITFDPSDTFDGTTKTNALNFYIDPIAGYSGTTTEGKAAMMWLYNSKRITSHSNIGTVHHLYGNDGPGTDPPWLKWKQ